MKRVIICFVLALIVSCASTMAQVKQPAKPSYPSLRAILIIGSTDETKYSYDEMKKIAEMLKEYKIKVFEFYNKKAVWDTIKMYASDAHIIVYNGHGIINNGQVGGLYLDDIIYGEKIKKELVLNKKPLIVMSSVCYSAGSSASDRKEISIKEAEQRVSDYSNMFFSVGASAYYATSIVGGCKQFLEEFLQGKTISDHFNAAIDWNTEIYNRYMYDSTKTIAIKSKFWGGTSIVTKVVNGVKKVEKVPAIKMYDIAFVAVPDFCIKKLVGKTK